MWHKLQQRVEQRQAQSLLRQRLTVASAQSCELKVEGQGYLNFSSNDYLGLANHPKMIEAMQHAAKDYGVGAGASHLIVGHSHHHHALEQELADFVGAERALLFSTGYMANFGVLTSLLDKQDLIVQDKLNHASLIDGGLASEAKMRRYAHNDTEALQRQLQSPLSTDTNSTFETKLVVTDGVFSMDGDIAPLQSIHQVCQQTSAQLMVDDAHGFGVLGQQGKGTVSHCGLPSCDIYMATLGKALGGFGAFVAGSSLLIESLIQFARSYIYTTAMPPAIAAANRMGLKLLQQEDWRREQLNKNIALFKQLAKQANLPLMQSDTAIQPILLKSNELVAKVSAELKQQGILALAIRPPTVPVNSARLRITLTAQHSEEQIVRLVEVLQKSVQVVSKQVANQTYEL
ncbi:MAG: 8-amino-7-oxononanoate synthase [Kangiellaceae bacterium]|nr:8-amino-7-oxononanoate synthase [Kangiellaceae bacterium]